MPTEDALYVVASAKFASESCMGVGRGTNICLLAKMTASNQKWVTPLQDHHINELRRLWERYGRPKIPKTDPALLEIASELGASTTTGSMRRMQRQLRKAAKAPKDASNAHEPPPGQSGGAAPA